MGNESRLRYISNEIQKLLDLRYKYHLQYDSLKNEEHKSMLSNKIKDCIEKIQTLQKEFDELQ